MAYSKSALNELYGYILAGLDISSEMFKTARTEYETLGKWIGMQSDYDVSIYPQGSFALGTVIKPISDKDDYDLDLVCELDSQYGLSAHSLKLDVVGSWLRGYRKITTMENKRRCWHVEYEDIPNFHMDVIPAFDTKQEYIRITEHDEENDEYSYRGSNPKGYTDWFYSRCEVQWNLLFSQYSKDKGLKKEEADIQKLDRNTVKTPLQKSIQLLKRHRDVMFKDLPQLRRKEKPVSILITTIAAELYNNEDNVTDALASFLDGAEAYIMNHCRNGHYLISNPSLPEENFADKWYSNPERKDAFIRWIRKAKDDLSFVSLQPLDKIAMGNHLKNVFGNGVVRSAFVASAEANRKGILKGDVKIDSGTGRLSESGEIPVPPNHHYHG